MPRKPLWITLVLILLATVLVSLGVGRFHIPIARVIGVLASHLIPLDSFWTDTDARVVELIRLPRILMAVLTGAAWPWPGPDSRAFSATPWSDRK